MNRIITAGDTRVNHLITPNYLDIVDNARMAITSIFDRIEEAYRTAGLPHSQTAMAKQIGVAQGAVGKWKAGGQVKPAHLHKIAEQTGVCVEWLNTGKWSKYPADPDTVELINELNAMSPKDRARYLRLARAMSDE